MGGKGISERVKERERKEEEEKEEEKKGSDFLELSNVRIKPSDSFSPFSLAWVSRRVSKKCFSSPQYFCSCSRWNPFHSEKINQEENLNFCQIVFKGLCLVWMMES